MLNLGLLVHLILNQAGPRFFVHNIAENEGAVLIMFQADTGTLKKVSFEGKEIFDPEKACWDRLGRWNLIAIGGLDPWKPRMAWPAFSYSGKYGPGSAYAGLVYPDLLLENGITAIAWADTLLVIASGNLMAVNIIQGNIRFSDGSEFTPDILEEPGNPNMARHPGNCPTGLEILLWDGLVFDTGGTRLSGHFIRSDASTAITECEINLLE